MSSTEQAKTERPRATKGGYPAGRKPSLVMTRNFPPHPSAVRRDDEGDRRD
ncbi:hypothetical protein [Angustibacter aerolatus]|nr:hypothetical protein [Angustibacter aerolatus]